MLTVPLRRERDQVTIMKSNRLILGVSAAVIVLAAAVVSVLSVKSNQKGGVLYMMSAKLQNTIEIPMNQIERLSVVYGSKNLEIHVWQEDKIVIKEYLNSSRKSALAEVSYEGDKVIVTGGQNSWQWSLLFWGGLGEKIEIYLPESGLKGLELETGSGNINASDALSLDGSVSVRAGSGNIKWSSTKADVISLRAGSGNVRAQGLSGDQVSVETNSGNITIQDVAGSLYSRAGSGNITIEELSGSCQAETGSGNIRVEAKQVTGDISLASGSGNQRLVLPKGLSFALQVNTGSGMISTDYDSALSYNKQGNAASGQVTASGQVGDAPLSQISSNAGSGNVSIRED